MINTPGLLKKYAVKPDYELGQNFMISSTKLANICKYLQLEEGDGVVEIGAGTGALTNELLAAGATVQAIEPDERFKPILAELQQTYPTLTTEWHSALTLSSLPHQKVAGNLPYKLALPIIFHLISLGFRRGVFTVQDTMATKLSAKPGKAKYGSVSVRISRLARVTLLETVSHKSFYPMPEVGSAIILVEPYKNPQFAVSEPAFTRMLDFFFEYRNLNVLDVIDSAFEQSRLKVRAHQILMPLERLAGRNANELSIYDFSALHNFFEEMSFVFPKLKKEKTMLPAKKFAAQKARYAKPFQQGKNRDRSRPNSRFRPRLSF